MITKFYYLNNIYNIIRNNFDKIVKFNIDKEQVYYNLCKFCKHDYILTLPYENFNSCYFDKFKIKRLYKNTYLLDNIIVYCVNKKYIYYLDFIQQICKNYLNLTCSKRTFLKIKFINEKQYYFDGKYNFKNNIHYILLNKNSIKNHYYEFSNMHLLFHEYLHFLLASYSLHPMFEEGLIEILINQDLKINCYCKKYIREALKRPYGQRQTPNMYILLKTWVYYLLLNNEIN